MAQAQPETGSADVEGTEGEGTSTRPQSTADTEQKIRDVFQAMGEHKDERTKANEYLSALREDLVTLGFPKKAQRAVAMYMDLNESDQEFFDEAVAIMRKALGKPLQGRLELVQ